MEFSSCLLFDLCESVAVIYTNQSVVARLIDDSNVSGRAKLLFGVRNDTLDERRDWHNCCNHLRGRSLLVVVTRGKKTRKREEDGSIRRNEMREEEPTRFMPETTTSNQGFVASYGLLFFRLPKKHSFDRA